MTARTVVAVHFTDVEDYDAATIEYTPDMVIIRPGPPDEGRTALIFFGADSAVLVDQMLNRLRFELAAQVAAREGES